MRLTYATVGVVTLAACTRDSNTPDDAAAADVRPEITAAQLRNASYRTQHMDEASVRLTEGTFVDTAQRVIVTLLPEYAVGDLNGDGSPDAAVVLATNTGGSGTFEDLVVVLNSDGPPAGTSTMFLGDRVPVDRIRIVDGVIEIELTMHGPADPMCCPTQETTGRFRLVDGELEETEPLSADANPQERATP